MKRPCQRVDGRRLRRGGAFDERPLLLDIAQARQPVRLPATAEIRRFFRVFTLIWGA